MDTLSFATREDSTLSEIVILEVNGSVDSSTVGHFESKIQELILDKKIKLILNLKKLNYISSAGMGILLYFNRHLKNSNGDLILTHINDKVQEVFEILELPRLLNVMNTVEDAINHFNGALYYPAERRNPERVLERANA